MAGKRFVVPVVENPWTVVINQWGQFVLRDSEGYDPLRHPDPHVTLLNLHLASQAPSLKTGMIEITRRFSSIHDGWNRDNQLVSWCFDQLYECRPLWSVERKVLEESQQVQMYFE